MVVHLIITCLFFNRPLDLNKLKNIYTENTYLIAFLCQINNLNFYFSFFSDFSWQINWKSLWLAIFKTTWRCLFCRKFNNIALNINSVMSIGDWGAKTVYSQWCYLISKWRVFIFFVEELKIQMQFVKKLRVYGAATFRIILNSACSKMLVTLKIFQFHDMLNESERYRVTANGLYVAVWISVSLYRYSYSSKSAFHVIVLLWSNTYCNSA
jgi:hypothetical protein